MWTLYSLCLKGVPPLTDNIASAAVAESLISLLGKPRYLALKYISGVSNIACVCFLMAVNLYTGR